ncbi:MAG: hypothetical protein H7Z13_11040 [Ferruginibacter sp.]|nr:hypothetical protein [Ferruginibacter sp.]
MIEVFKTNVFEQDHAEMLIVQLHKTFLEIKANFDLEDCDNILRIKYTTGSIQPAILINFLKDFGFDAEVLPDTVSLGGKLFL